MGIDHGDKCRKIDVSSASKRSGALLLRIEIRGKTVLPQGASLPTTCLRLSVDTTEVIVMRGRFCVDGAGSDH